MSMKKDTIQVRKVVIYQSFIHQINHTIWCCQSFN